VVNKADREGADRLVTELSLMLDLSPSRGGWRPPIIKTVATMGDGIQELAEKILAHRKSLEEDNGLIKKRNNRAREEILNLIEQEIRRSSSTWTRTARKPWEKKCPRESVGIAPSILEV